MKILLKLVLKIILLRFLFLTAIASFPVMAEQTPVLIHAARVFDGTNMRTNTSVLVINGKIAQIDSREEFKSSPVKVIDLGDATLLPGFIELHAHLAFQHIPADVVLRHGITTLRDVGGPLHQPYGGDGSLRVLTSGPIITAVNGYPIPGMGADNIAVPVATEEQARATVNKLIAGGAVVIKVALEPGGEVGAPWASGHGHGHEDKPVAGHDDPHHQPAHKTTDSKMAWPLLPENIVKAIVDEAHKHHRKVAAHIGEEKGAELAINAGIDEWAHVPCDVISEPLLKKAVAQQVKIVTTIDTLSKCPGITHNVNRLAALDAEFLYGAEVAHPDIPWGIDAQELIYMMHMAKMQPMEVLHTATQKAGRYLNIPLLGTLQSGAPADMIAVKGDLSHSFKTLEYPDLVMSGGKIIVNNFVNEQSVLRSY
ncbi:amidohydrolase family protein [Methylobacter psychrophilus]|uniref:amidohydrolase family protein n=1 Tax=Methylobacter psychrophilus TaxID=96941 RepID=UPI0021D51788|nr:amidohydrolase family protein [Methylobacter psychrophilus]